MVATLLSLFLFLIGVCCTAAFSAKMPAPPARFITNKMCPFAQKSWVALECAEVPYRLEEVSLYGAGGKPDWFWELNPAGTVPVLVVSTGDGEKQVVLPDSDDIITAIERGEIDGVAPALVAASKDNPQVQEWRSLINRKLIPVGKQAVLGGSSNQKTKLNDLLQELEAKVAGPFLVGDSVTTADCHAFPFLWRIEQEFGLADCPALNGWLKRCQQEPAFRKTIQRSWWWWW